MPKEVSTSTLLLKFIQRSKQSMGLRVVLPIRCRVAPTDRLLTVGYHVEEMSKHHVCSCRRSQSSIKHVRVRLPNVYKHFIIITYALMLCVVLYGGGISPESRSDVHLVINRWCV